MYTLITWFLLFERDLIFGSFSFGEEDGAILTASNTCPVLWGEGLLSGVGLEGIETKDQMNTLLLLFSDFLHSSHLHTLLVNLKMELVRWSLILKWLQCQLSLITHFCLSIKAIQNSRKSNQIYMSHVYHMNITCT